MIGSYNEFVASLERAEAAGPLLVELSPTQAVSIIGIIQLACRHPGTRGSASRETAEAFARLMQASLERRSPDLGRLVERGWHEVFDVPTENNNYPT
ncbi:MAG TPA: hypothetical protein VMG10_10780 [Gemmataceae bacterium]|nr:hypothetical protein [Gemmataceae bacterium]